MDDWRLSPLLQVAIQLVCVREGVAGMHFACTYGDIKFCTGPLAELKA